MSEGEKSKKCNGVKKSVVKQSIAHEDYKKCLFMGKEQLRKMNVIRSYTGVKAAKRPWSPSIANTYEHQSTNQPKAIKKKINKKK